MIIETFRVKWLPAIAVSRCTGCYRCVAVCQSASLEVRGHVAMLVQPLSCGSEGHCVTACPENAIRMGWVEMEGDRARGKWRAGGRVWPGRIRGGGRQRHVYGPA